MKGRRSDTSRLLDMLDRAERIERAVKQFGADRLADDDLRYEGLVRMVGIIGEAAYQLSRELRAAHPEVPWRQIIAMRHVIVHDYDEVDENRIWEVIKLHLPILRQQLQTIIASLTQ